jgi:hypothetical protein
VAESLLRPYSSRQPLFLGGSRQVLNLSSFQSSMDPSCPVCEPGENPLQRRSILLNELLDTEKSITDKFGLLVQKVTGISEGNHDQFFRPKGSATLELSSSVAVLEQFIRNSAEPLGSSGVYKVLITIFDKTSNTSIQYEDVVAKVSHVANKRFSIQLGKQWTALILERTPDFILASNSDRKSEIEIYVKCLGSNPLRNMQQVFEKGVDLPVTHKLKPDGSSLISIPRWAMEIINRLPNSNRVKDRYVRFKFTPNEDTPEGHEDEYTSLMQEMYWGLSHGQFVLDGRYRNYAFSGYRLLHEGGKTYKAKLEVESERTHQDLFDKMFESGAIQELEWVEYYYYIGKQEQLRAKFEELKTSNEQESNDFMRRVEHW